MIVVAKLSEPRVNHQPQQHNLLGGLRCKAAMSAADHSPPASVSLSWKLLRLQVFFCFLAPTKQ